MCVSSSRQQQRMMLAGTQCQQKMMLELYLAPVDLTSMVYTQYSCVVFSFIRKSTLSLCVVILAFCGIFSTVASERPATHEESSANRQPLRRSDRPGARH